MTGLYGALRFTEETNEKLWNFSHLLLGVKDYIPRKEYHSTVVYSRRKLPYAPALNQHIIIDPSTYKWLIFKPYLVLSYQNSDVIALWNDGIKMGATWDFEEYFPHVSIATPYEAHVWELPDFPLVVSDLYTCPLNEDLPMPNRQNRTQCRRMRRRLLYRSK